MANFRYHKGMGLMSGFTGNPQLDEFIRRIPKFVTEIKQISTAITPGSVPANSTSEQAFTVLGVASTDQVRAVKPTHTVGIILGNCRVSAKDTVQLTFGNLTAGAVVPPAETYIFVVEKIKGA